MPPDRTPLTAYCHGCDHSWAVAHLPMPLADAAELMTQAACPSCAETARIFMGPRRPEDRDPAPPPFVSIGEAASRVLSRITPATEARPRREIEEVAHHGR